MQVAILGRQPALSLAELESLFGAEKINVISDYAAVVDSEDPLPQALLGGTMKSAKLLTRLKKTGLPDAFAYLQTSIPEHLHYLPEGKLQLGVSVYGFKAQRDWLLRQMLSLKKIIKKNDRSVRIIENKSEALETAQILYNKLTGSLGWELLLIKDGSDVIVAQTTAVQDIDAYSERDFGRPKRDAYVGMLPPKLAQIMINLVNPAVEATVLDPFCGTGVVLQEARLMQYKAQGSDIEPRMVEYSKENLTWLFNDASTEVTVADATTAHWKDFDTVVCETYLGKPLTALPHREKLQQIADEANTIAEKFLKNLQPQLKNGAKLSLALPAWNIGHNQFLHLKMLDHLSDLGYNRLEFVHAKKTELIYHRENQIVARELTILEKK